MVTTRILSWYARLASKPPFSALNDMLLKAALRGRGYNGSGGFRDSGEDFFLSNVLAKAHPAVCLDVGANVGRYSEQLLVHTQARVISFEPLPWACERLQARLQAFGERSVVVPKGVADASGRLTLHHNPASPQLASFSQEVDRISFVNNHRSLEVDVVTLDDYLQSHPCDDVSFIKIDTEGYEGEVLKGAAMSLLKYRPRFIQIEFNRHQLFRDRSLLWFAERLPDRDVYQLIPDGWVRRDPTDPLANIFEFSNFVFVQRG